MFGLGTTELIIILVIVVIVFGAGKLPNVMKDIGKGVKSFKSAMSEADETIQKTDDKPVIEGAKREDPKNS